MAEADGVGFLGFPIRVLRDGGAALSKPPRSARSDPPYAHHPIGTAAQPSFAGRLVQLVIPADLGRAVRHRKSGRMGVPVGGEQRQPFARDAADELDPGGGCRRSAGRR